MSRYFGVTFCFAVLICSTAKAQKQTEPVTEHVWQEAVISVTDLYNTARFFREIGGYQVKWRGLIDDSAIASWNLPKQARGEAMVIGPSYSDTGLIRLVRFDNAGRKVPMRPGARAWDSGCYFSLMIRMKGMQDIYDDAIRLGWWSETPMTFLEFGTSKLNVMIFRGPDGVQVQGYERLSPPLPKAIPDFERMTAPFNMMQMVSDRAPAYDFFTKVLGFDTFFHGKPYVDKEPTYTPLGIPYNLTTTVHYQTGIVYPKKGEFGRMEMIDIIDLQGRDHSARCVAPNLGILAVRFPVDDLNHAQKLVTQRGASIESVATDVKLAPYGTVNLFTMKTPDGAIVQFFEKR